MPDGGLFIPLVVEVRRERSFFGVPHRLEPNLNLDAELIAEAHPVEPLSVVPDTSVREVFALMKAQKTGSVIICSDGKVAGIFTERDALNLMAQGASLDAPISEVMITTPATLHADDTVGTAVKRMSEGGYRRLPVVDGEGRCVSFLKVSGIIRYLIEHFPQTVYNLPPEPSQVMQTREGA
ncbi:MAG: CBS domain-containing protein [Planctomycetales bacterium]|nr:CBS domain-containing protein [Planctomycetales bacterium]